MFVIDLPKYTTERYYLLSEIEELTDVVFLEESETTETASKNPKQCALLYILFDMNKALEQGSASDKVMKVLIGFILSAVQQLDQTVLLSLLNSHICCFIEVYLDSYRNRDEIVTYFAYASEQVQLKSPNCSLLFGVANKRTGSAALEMLMDVMQRLDLEVLEKYNEFNFSRNYFYVVANRRADFLGHDPDREPDADSDVTQFLCHPEKFDLEVLKEHCIKNWVEHNRSNGRMISELAPKNSSNAIKLMNDRVFYSRVGFFVCVFIAFVLYRWYSM